MKLTHDGPGKGLAPKRRRFGLPKAGPAPQGQSGGRRVGPPAAPLSTGGVSRGRRVGPVRPGTVGKSGGRKVGPRTGLFGKPEKITINAVTQRSMPQGGKDLAGAKSRLARRLGKG